MTHFRRGYIQFAMLLILLQSTTACIETRDMTSTLHPHDPGRPFQEMSIDLTSYKSPQMRPFQDDELNVAMSISGGGERAAAFAAGVFIGLEKLRRSQYSPTHALHEVDYFSTVSGGGMAAGVYISKLFDYLNPKDKSLAGTVDITKYSFENHVYPERQLTETKSSQTVLGVREALAHSYVDDLLEGFFNLATLGKINRGDFLERSFDDKLLDYNARGRALLLKDIYVPRGNPRNVRLPLLVANATAFENGAIFPFIPHHIANYRITEFTHRLKSVEIDKNKQNYVTFASEIPVSLALKTSGTFPVAVPATTLKSDYDPSNPYLHLLDGGLADNLGIITALRLIQAETHTNVKRRVLISVDAFKDGYAPFSKFYKYPSAIRTIFRVIDISFDSRRGRIKEMVKALSNSDQFGENFNSVFLSFDDFSYTLNTPAAFYDLRQFGLSLEDMHELGVTRDNLKKINGYDPTPYLLARNISTDYRITKAEFNFLIAAGQYIVFQQQDEIRKAFGWPITEPE